ncbi:hypothetical protein PVAP13_2NG606600 [Panicum virgatum]|uniref:Uncharacterized protein n=1 Tax=Panicum virgatum TaxID=38727 RepID=A0A8T0W4Z5_PANVG|nr:hypothetical protein PVAP13_2NG606600 [Panicum virgatum]KAG2638509.1 hypothetical protein PVAP13_2NG606600 [Panicum virgatum]KAG2638512.1 hypothetical protein PVAP13_2NG606600 [Panicum virgatum]
MRSHQGLESHLNRKRDLAGTRERISTRASSEGHATRARRTIRARRTTARRATSRLAVGSRRPRGACSWPAACARALGSRPPARRSGPLSCGSSCSRRCSNRLPPRWRGRRRRDGRWCTVDTVFNGSTLGIKPHTIEVTPTAGLVVLDSINSTIYRSCCHCHHVSSCDGVKGNGAATGQRWGI